MPAYQNKPLVSRNSQTCLHTTPTITQRNESTNAAFPSARDCSRRRLRHRSPPHSQCCHQRRGGLVDDTATTDSIHNAGGVRDSAAAIRGAV